MQIEKIVEIKANTSYVDVEFSEISLLSAWEVMPLERSLLKRGEDWWLAAKGSAWNNSVAYVDQNGYVHWGGTRADDSTLILGVRPVLRIGNPGSCGFHVGDRISLAGLTWTVIPRNAVLCDSILNNMEFRKNTRVKNVNEYRKSDIAKWLNKWAAENGIEFVSVPDTELEFTNITLLSIEEAEKVNQNIRACGYDWWLRSAGSGAQCVAFVTPEGEIDTTGWETDSMWPGVRPALEVDNLKMAGLEIGNKVRVASKVWTVIADNLLLCNEFIGFDCFNTEKRAEGDMTNYEKSQVRILLMCWADANGIPIKGKRL